MDRRDVQALALLWEAAGFPWSVRLKALLPLWLPWLRQRITLTPEVERQLLAISPRQLDRRLKPHKSQLRRHLYGRTRPGILLKHHIPIQTASARVGILHVATPAAWRHGCRR